MRLMRWSGANIILGILLLCWTGSTLNDAFKGPKVAVGDAFVGGILAILSLYWLVSMLFSRGEEPEEDSQAAPTAGIQDPDEVDAGVRDE